MLRVPSVIKNLKKLKGISIVEVLLSASIMGIISATIIAGLITSQQTNSVLTKQTRALGIAEEGIEAARNIRDYDWDLLAVGNHGLQQSGGWSFSGSSDTVGEFTRQVTVSTVDANTKDVTVVVTWQQTLQRTGQVTLEVRLTNWQDNAGASAGSSTPTPTPDGSITPTPTDGPVVQGDWSDPCEYENIDIPETLTDIDQDGDYVFAIGMNDLYTFDVSDPDNISLIDSYNLADLQNDIVVQGGYAYIASQRNNTELQIIDVTTPDSPSVAGSLDLTGDEDATAVEVSADGNTVYLGRATTTSGPEFYTIDVTNKQSPVLLDSGDAGGNVHAIERYNDYAYLAVENSIAELVTYDVATPANITPTAAYNVGGSEVPSGLAVLGTDLVMSRENRFIYFNLSTTPDNPPYYENVWLGGGIVNDIEVNETTSYQFSGYTYFSTQFRVFDRTDDSQVVSETVTSDINDLVYDINQDRIYAASANIGGEFMALKSSGCTAPTATPTGGPSNGWDSPSIEGTLDLTDVTDIVDLKVQGNYAYVVTEGSTNDTLWTIDISDPTSPNVVDSDTTIDTPGGLDVISGEVRVGDGEDSSEYEAYLLTNPDNPSYDRLYNLGGTDEVSDIFINKTNTSYTYFTRAGNVSEADFYVLNEASDPVPTSSSLEIGTTANAFTVLGDYAYLVTNDSNRELRVIDVSNPASPTQIAYRNFGVCCGTDIVGYGSYIYAIIGNRLAIYGVANPGSPTSEAADFLGATNSYSIDYDPSLNYTFFGVDDRMMVVDVTDVTGGVIVSDTDNGDSNPVKVVDYDATLDRVVAGRNNSSSEIIIYKPNP